MISKTRTTISYLLLGGFAAVAAAFASGPPQYDLSWYTIDGGGGTSTGGDFTLVSSIGQPDAGTMSGGNFTLQGGFLHGGVAAAPCPADIDENGSVGSTDLLALLAAWGPCAGCPEDIDDSGSVGSTDLLDLLAAWGACP